jgi:hypothetical protein
MRPHLWMGRLRSLFDLGDFAIRFVGGEWRSLVGGEINDLVLRVDRSLMLGGFAIGFRLQRLLQL